MAHKPLKATDKRRQVRKHKPVSGGSDSTGSGAPLADLFNDRKKRNGTSKRAG
jgi:hypothetical protein